MLDPQTETMAQPRWEYEYWPSGELKIVRDPLGRETYQEFDAQGRRTLRELPALPGQTAGDAEHWSYDTLGRMETHQDAAGNLTSFVYDDLGRTEEERFYQPGQSAPAATVHRTYDALSRPQSVDDSAYGLTNYEYDTAGRTTLVASPEGVLHYAFDPATGRLTRTHATADTSPESAITSDVRYAYDPFGRLFTVTAVVQGGVTLAVPEVTTYGYDLAG